MPLTTDELRKVIHDHIVNKCPLEVWEREYKRYLNSCKSVSNFPIWVDSRVSIDHSPVCNNVDQYKKQQIDQYLFWGGKHEMAEIKRKAKKKDKITNNVIRVFSALVFSTHKVIVTSDPTDVQVISIEYIQ